MTTEVFWISFAGRLRSDIHHVGVRIATWWTSGAVWGVETWLLTVETKLLLDTVFTLFSSQSLQVDIIHFHCVRKRNWSWGLLHAFCMKTHHVAVSFLQVLHSASFENIFVLGSNSAPASSVRADVARRCHE